MNDNIVVEIHTFKNNEEAEKFWNELEKYRDKDVEVVILPSEPAKMVKSAFPSMDDMIREKINNKTKNLKHFKKLATRILEILYGVGD